MTLDDVLVRYLGDLARDEAGDCLLCGGPMAVLPVVAGRHGQGCRTCGTVLEDAEPAAAMARAA